MVEHNYCHGFYRFIKGFAAFLAPFVLLVVRVFFGLLFIKAGLGKLADVNATTAAFAQADIPAPGLMVYLVGLLEIVCGAGLVLGFASRLVTIPLIVIMIVAMLTAHKDAAFNVLNNPDNFAVQAPIPYLLASLAVFLFGPGYFSIDYIFEKLVCKDHCHDDHCGTGKGGCCH